jgi:hypothetical protein
MGLLRGVRFLVSNDTNSQKMGQNGGWFEQLPGCVFRANAQALVAPTETEEVEPVPPPLLTRFARSLSPPPRNNYL